MTKHFNKKIEKEKRRSLRNNMTYCEKMMWIHLRRKQLGYRFLRQYSIDHYVIDFYSPRLKPAVELDGDIHEQAEQRQKDNIRQRYLEEFKITFIRIRNEELMGNSNKAFEKIEKAIKEIEKDMGKPLPSSPL